MPNGHIIVADDDAAIRTVLNQALSRAGYEVRSTGNCATCISKLEDGKVSLLPHADAALGKAQLKSGLTLACRARPRSDVTINWLARRAS